MLFAIEMSAQDGVVGAVGLAVMGFLGFVGTRLTNAAALERRIGELTSQVFKLTDENHKCEARTRDQQAELQRAFSRIMHLEKYSGIGPGEPTVGVIIADLTGKIQEFSPTLTALFRWLPGEVIGENIAKLMPVEVRDPALRALRLFAGDSRTVLDSTKLILTEGMNKHGGRFPIVLSLRGWQAGDTGLVTATIRERDVASPVQPAVVSVDPTLMVRPPIKPSGGYAT